LFNRYDSVNTQRQRDKQRLADLERNLNEERQNKQRLETQIKTEKTLTKKLQDDFTKLTLTPAKFVFYTILFLLMFCFISRSECTEQCLKRKRDLENEIREIRRLLNDKDERIKLLDNEIKVNSFT
jgi:DNA repair exonuclease SbcCD ATPase subunit